MSKSEKGVKCRLWTGAKDKDGYGFVKLGGTQARAHRVSLELKIGRRLKAREIAIHLCDNPQCFEPKHLIVGTVKENNRLAREKSKSLANVYLKGWQKLYGSGS